MMSWSNGVFGGSRRSSAAGRTPSGDPESAAASFGHGGAFSTQSWADPAKGLIWIVMFERDGKGNPDNSDVRIAFQEAAGLGK